MPTKISKKRKVPNLRFSEFAQEWVERNFSEIGVFFKGKGISKEQLSEDGVPCILYGELYTKYQNEVIDNVHSRTSIDLKGLVTSKINDVIIPSSGETAIDISTACCVNLDDVLLGGDLNIIRPHTDNGNFISYQLNGKRKNQIAKIAQGSSVVHLYNDSLKKLKVFLPKDINEQGKISSLLSLLGQRISTQSKIIHQLQSLIKGICQSLTTNEDSKNWRKQHLRDVLTERKESNTDKNPVFSVSVSRGVINQIEYLGRSFAAKNTDHYNVVHFGDIVYTKSPTGEFPYGIIKQSFIRRKVAVSPLYGVFIPQSIEIGNILDCYFANPVNANNYLHSLIQKGAKNTINITNQNFLNNEIYLPCDIMEIKKIAQLLDVLKEKIVLETNILKGLNLQKKYLLQNLFI